MPFNEVDHVVLHEIRVPPVADGGPTAIIVEVISYKGGPPKIQLTRYNTNKDGEERRAKLGRIFSCEVNNLVDALLQAKMLISSGTSYSFGEPDGDPDDPL